MSKKNQHVVPHPNRWAVKGEGNAKPSAVRSTQQGAFGIARGLAKNQKTEVFIHGKNGRIRERNTYGKDPYPPKG